MATPSLSISEDLLGEVEERCDLNRSRYIRDAIEVRMMLEDEGEWFNALSRVKAPQNGTSEAQAEN